MSYIHTEIYKKYPLRTDMCGQSLPQQLYKIEGAIAQGMAKRLINYANERMRDAGFDCFLGQEVVVVTTDGDEPPPERNYSVEYRAKAGGIIKVIGIMTQRGWPFLDHGFDIEQA